MSTSVLDYTGERMVPEAADPNTFWEHVYRYKFATQFVKDKRVLDVACGEGYGTAALLKAGAKSVIGVDISEEACLHASAKYGVETIVGSAENIPLPNKSVDLIVSFETIEHLIKPEIFLKECVRVLTDKGQIIVSTPNRDIYSEQGHHNSFSRHEMNKAEFVSLLNIYFNELKLFTQRPKSASWWSPRSIVASQSYWHTVKGFRRIRHTLSRLFFDKKHGELSKSIREAIINSISCKYSLKSSIMNPYYVRQNTIFDSENAFYLIALAKLKA